MIIILFSANYEHLDNILLDDKGNVHEFNDKLYLSDVLELKRKAADDTKTVKKLKTVQNHNLEEEILNTPSFFKAHHNSSKKSSQTSASKSKINLAVRAVEIITSPIKHTSLGYNIAAPSSSSGQNISDMRQINSSSLHCTEDIVFKVNDIASEPLDFSMTSKDLFITSSCSRSSLSTNGEVSTNRGVNISSTNTEPSNHEESLIVVAENFEENNLEESPSIDAEEVNITEEKESSEFKIGALHTFMPNNCN